MESDTHADTTAVGKNSLVLNFRDQRCTVTPFADSHQPMKDVPVETAAAAWDNPAMGQLVILIFHQALHFPEMKSSLICPNQVRSHGVGLCDDPYDPFRAIGLSDPETGTKIPFDVQGSMVGVTTRAPTFEECQLHPHVVLTSDEPWDPHSPNLPHHSRSDEEDEAADAALIGAIRSE